jgi:nitrogen fixation/metabolism regulation signal transduction histidine kinase
MRIIFLISGSLGLMLLYLISLLSTKGAATGEYYKTLLILNAILAAVLVGFIGMQLWQLAKRMRSGQMGSRLTLRLLGTYALMAIVPGMLVYLVSVNFLTRSIESWFNVKVESALDGGLSLGQRALDIMLADVQEKAENMATTLAFQPSRSVYGQLNDLREKTGIQDATLMTLQGRIIAVSNSDPSSFLPELPNVRQLRQAEHRSYSKIEPIADKGLYLRVLAPVSGQELSGETLILQLLQPVPKSLSNTAESVQSVYSEYQQLSYSRNAMKEVFTLTLTLVLMLCMLTALAIAFVLSKRLMQPLTVLADGTRAIARGDYNIVLPEHGRDELGVLVKSFNSMTRQVGDATKATEQSRLRTEAARNYLETVLAHLSSGVLAINQQAELRIYNLTASNILGINLNMFERKQFTDIAAKESYLIDFVNLIKSHFEHTKQAEFAKEELNQQLEVVSPSGKKLLLVRATRLPGDAENGFVVVFDDVTTMAQAQRDAAWGEVARRLAHEIKNPLTPIQLSAERLQHRLADKLDKEDAAMLKRGTNTIVNQVGALKSMVNEFSEYARAPAAKFSKLNLNQLIHDVAEMYQGAAEGNHPNGSNAFAGRFELMPDMPDMMGDATMLRQVLHNLMQNAQDACSQVAEPNIVIQTMFDDASIKLKVSDNGQGFPLNLLSQAFEPYITTKPHGTGLGLAIVKKIVEEHAGQIKLENNPTGGACVTIVLPRLAVQESKARPKVMHV